MGPVVIVGIGAIGTWLAVRLARSGEERIVLITRPEQAETIHREGLHLDVLPAAQGGGTEDGTTEDATTQRWHVPAERFDVVAGKDRSRARDAASQTTDEPAVAADLDDALLFVTTRAYQTREAADMMRSLRGRPRRVVTLQNGLGNAEALADVFDETRVIAGTTTHGVTSTGAGRARHAGPGRTVIGAWTEDPGPDVEAEVRRLVGRLGSAGIATEVTEDPRRAVWEKVVVNAAINPLTALHEVPNGALLERPDLRSLMERACREAVRVARAEGLPLDEERAVASAEQVARQTALNESSMLQAKRAGRRLELDAITGEIVRRAARHGIPVPVNARLLEALG